MKKTKVKALAITLLAAVLCAGTVTARAETLSRSIDGIGFSASSQIDASSAFAQTVSSSPKLTVSVDATYYYINVSQHTFSNETKSAEGMMARTVSFSVPNTDIYESYDISAYHTAETSNETWSGSTYEKY